MTKRRSAVFGIVIAILALSLTGCPERRQIADVTADPARYMNKEVTIVGRVTNAYGALGQGIYEIDDGTGRMWVFTEKYGVPSKNGYVGVTGRVIPGVTYAGRNYATVLRETKRRSRPKS